MHSASKQLRSVKSAESLISSGGHSGRNSEILESCNSSSDASRVQPFQWLPEVTTPASSPTGAHKHVRSVSHDSYFERGVLDLSLEEINATFELVAKSAFSGASPRPSPPQKSPRKQKLCSEAEGANSAKVQRLAESNTFQSSHRPIELFPVGKIECTSYASSQPQLPTFGMEEEPARRRQSSSRSLTPFSSRQPLAVHSPDDIEPYTSPSPQEAMAFRSEQLRNALLQHNGHHNHEKMVLVEVHAVEEQSSTEQLIRGGLVFHRPFVEEVDNHAPSENLYDSSTDADESDGHAETSISLAEDIATSLKMSCCPFDTDFLVGEPHAAAETSFLNRVSASLPYIEDTDTSASPLSSPCAGCELLPLETSAESPVSSVQGDSSAEAVEDIGPAPDPLDLEAECVDCPAHSSSPVMQSDNLRTFLDTESNKSLTSIDTTLRVEALNCGIHPASSESAVILLETAKESSTSEEEDNEEAMPYSYLEESPLLSEAYGEILHSHSQDQSLCLLSPAEANVDRINASNIVSCIKADETEPESLGATEMCVVQVESSQSEQTAMVCDIVQEEAAAVCEHNIPEPVNFGMSCSVPRNLSWDEGLHKNAGSTLLNSSPGIDPNTLDLFDPLSQTEGNDNAIVSGKTPQESNQLNGLEPTLPECLSEFITSPGTPQKTLSSELLCISSAGPLSSPCKLENYSVTQNDSKPLIEFGDDDVQLRSSPRPPQILDTKRKSEPRQFGANGDDDKKRLSEPVARPRSDKRGSVKELMSRFEPSESQAPSADASPSRASQPSLFTQLKVMRLQSLKTNPTSPPSSNSYDPWSDPILDDQDISLEHMQEVPCLDMTVKGNVDFVEVEDWVRVPEPDVQSCKADLAETEIVLEVEVSDAQRPTTLELRSVNVPSQADGKEADPVQKAEEAGKCTASLPFESDVRRKRIEKIKEERRAQLREKLKSESFRTDDGPRVIDVVKQRRTSDGEIPNMPVCGADPLPARRTVRAAETQKTSESRPMHRQVNDRKRDLTKQAAADPVSTERKPARVSQHVEPVTKRQDLSPPKRIRDRAAMFECRGKKETPHPQPRLARADLSSC